MKTLLIMRHAKSDWEDASLRDYDRPLNKRGRKDAHRMGEALKLLESVPERIYTSSANRAATTTEKLSQEFHCNGCIEYIDDFYESSAGTMIKRIKEFDDKYHTVMVVGHNPTLEHLAFDLTSAHFRMPTAAILRLELEIISWQDIKSGCGEVQWFILPKMVKAISKNKL